MVWKGCPQDQYLALYNISHNKSDIIVEVLVTTASNAAFRRNLDSVHLATHNILQRKLALVLSQGKDEF
jgi:hypothetical protein